jgi:quinol monooxygenase YgiN
MREDAGMKCGYLASMRTRSGCRDAVAAILVGGAEGLRAAGCHSYLVSLDPLDEDRIWVHEVWESKAQHDASLQLPAAKTAIATAMPMLTGEFTRQELQVLGGLGV